jgi:toxin-antitoxin system PIN domain toxin
MKLVDANVLLYATNAGAPQHAVCRAWLEDAVNGSEPIGFAWVVLLAFLRIATKPQVFRSPLSPAAAFDRVRLWLSAPAAVIVHPGERHVEWLEGLLSTLGTAGNLTSDAHLAAIALEHGAAIVSCDSDFARFSGITHLNPLRT